MSGFFFAATQVYGTPGSYAQSGSLHGSKSLAYFHCPKRQIAKRAVFPIPNELPSEWIHLPASPVGSTIYFGDVDPNRLTLDLQPYAHTPTTFKTEVGQEPSTYILPTPPLAKRQVFGDAPSDQCSFGPEASGPAVAKGIEMPHCEGLLRISAVGGWLDGYDQALGTGSAACRLVINCPRPKVRAVVHVVMLFQTYLEIYQTQTIHVITVPTFTTPKPQPRRLYLHLR